MAFFDPVAPEYDKWYQTPIGRFLDEVETKLAFDLFTPRAGARVLDAGCGSGLAYVSATRRSTHPCGHARRSRSSI